MGSFLDPLADKVLVGGTFIACGVAGLLHPAVVALGIARDVGLVAGGFYIRAKSKPDGVGFFDFSHPTSFAMEPTTVSKVNTAGQLGLCAVA